MRQIRAHLGADPFAKLLLTGHIGVGKSTELYNLAGEMQSERWVVRCSVADTLGVHNVNTFSLLVVLLEATMRSWVEVLGEMPPGLVEDLVQHVRTLLPKERRPPKTPAETLRPTAADLKTGAHARKTVRSGEDLLRIYFEVLQSLAVRSVPLEQVAALDPSPLALSCETVLKELADAAANPVLLVIDDLDKVRDDDARDDVFLNRAMAWRRLPCGIVSTLPLDAVFSTIGPDLDQVWVEGPQVLDPFPVPMAQGGAVRDEALQPYLSILRSVDAHEVISAHQCRRLANASSGLPRNFVSACATCVRYALEAGQPHVRDYHVDLALRDIAERWQGRLNDSDYEALVDVLDSGGSNVPKAITLLRDGVLIRDGAAPPDQRFRLANWAESLVDAFRARQRGKKSAPA
jgi:hypothetical protein